jgi:uncharacterized protein
MIGKWINGYFERRYAAQFNGQCPRPPWDHLYECLPADLLAMAERGEPKAAYVLGDMFDQGTHGLNQNLDKAVIYYRLAEVQGDPNALNNLGSMNHHGEGLEQSIEIARFYYERAVAGGCAAAMNNLGRMYLEGQAGLPVDTVKGLALLEQGARAHDGNAALMLAAVYRDGQYGCRKSQRQRIYWLWHAAYNGSGVGYNVLGDLYRAGKVLPKNDVRAFALYRKGADLGDADSMYQVGLSYLSGAGAPKDLDKARAHLEQAAEHGFEDPDDFLGRLTKLHEDGGEA